MKLQYIHMYLAIVADLMGVTDEGSVPEVARCGPCCLPVGVFTASKGSNFYILFVITAAVLVPCGGTKMSSCTSPIVQII